MRFFFFFFNDTATTEIYTLSLHDALPIFAERTAPWRLRFRRSRKPGLVQPREYQAGAQSMRKRSEEHTSELQSLAYLVCRLLLEKKKKYQLVSTITRTPSYYILLSIVLVH